MHSRGTEHIGEVSDFFPFFIIILSYFIRVRDRVLKPGLLFLFFILKKDHQVTSTILLNISITSVV